MKEFILRYTKSVYDDKYDAVNRELARLKNNLGELTSLREQMFTFWNDESARQAGEMLQRQINTVKNEIHTVEGWLATYQTITDQLDRGAVFIEDAANEAIGALEAVGGLAGL